MKISRLALPLLVSPPSRRSSRAVLAQKEVVVWHAYRAEEKAAFEKVVAAYNAANAAKGVKVTTLAVPYDAFADKITAAVPRGKGPDIFIYAQDRLGGWIEAGQHHRADRLLPRQGDDGPLHPDDDGGDDLPRHRLRPAAELQGHHAHLQQEARPDARRRPRRSSWRWRRS